MVKMGKLAEGHSLTHTKKQWPCILWTIFNTKNTKISDLAQY